MSQEETVETREDWNDGSFDKTSADRDEESGELGIGYISGSSTPIDTTQPFVEDQFIYYRMDSSGTQTDYSGNNNDGSVSGSPSGVSGVFGTNALSFDGSNDFIDTGWTNWGDMENNVYVFSFWLKASQIPEGWIMGRTPDHNIRMRGRDGDTFETFLAGTGGGVNRLRGVLDVSESEIWDGEWHHLVIEVDVPNETITYYFDGVEENTSYNARNDPGSFDEEGEPWLIGSESTSPDHNGVEFDEVKIFQVDGFSESDAQTLYFDGQQNNNFEGSYESKKLELNGEADEITIDASVSSGETLTATVVALDSEEDEIDTSDPIDVEDGENTYEVENLSEGDSYRVDFEMEADQ